MGPRRVGKTVMMLHAIQQLIDDKIDPQKIFFVAIDNPIYMPDSAIISSGIGSANLGSLTDKV